MEYKYGIWGYLQKWYIHLQGKKFGGKTRKILKTAFEERRQASVMRLNQRNLQWRRELLTPKIIQEKM